MNSLPSYDEIFEAPPSYLATLTQDTRRRDTCNASTCRIVLNCVVKHRNGTCRYTLTTDTSISWKKLLRLIRRRFSVASRVHLSGFCAEDTLWLHNKRDSRFFLLDNELWHSSRLFLWSSDWEVVLQCSTQEFTAKQDWSFRQRLNHAISSFAVSWHERTTSPHQDFK